MWAATQPSHKATGIPTQHDCREVSPNRVFFSMPLIKPSMMGHTDFCNLHLCFFHMNPLMLTLGIQLPARHQEKEISRGKSSDYKAALPPWAVPVDMQASKVEKKFSCTRQQDLCVVCFRQQLLQSRQKPSNFWLFILQYEFSFQPSEYHRIEVWCVVWEVTFLWWYPSSWRENRSALGQIGINLTHLTSALVMHPQREYGCSPTLCEWRYLRQHGGIHLKMENINPPWGWWEDSNHLCVHMAQFTAPHT